MKISIVQDFAKREKGDVLIVPCWTGPSLACERSFPEAAQVLSSGDFLGKAGETALLYVNGIKESRLLLLGLGDQQSLSVESLRCSYASAVKAVQAKKLRNVHLIVPKFLKFPIEHAIRGIFEGVFLANYVFDQLKGDTPKENLTVLIDNLSVSGVDKKVQRQIDRIHAMASAVYFVRDLVNGNADEISPSRLAKEALKLGKGIKTTVLDRKQLESEGMGLLLAVGRAAVDEPRLICSTYRGNPKSKDTVVLIGKGITYDTGGLCLKTPDGMLTMKSDMAGAATVLAVVKLAAELGLKVNVTALAPVAENAIGSRSYKQGDVYRSCCGKTVEILNTDAEGRLVLADAIAYAVKYLKPSSIIDIGTLTGGIVVALGEEIAGLFSNDEKIARDFREASDSTGEIAWRLPLHDYKESLRSEIADLGNMGGREAGSMKCALFLQEFTNGVPWAHIDMAGPAFISKAKKYHPAKGTGWGVRLLIDFLERK